MLQEFDKIQSAVRDVLWYAKRPVESISTELSCRAQVLGVRAGLDEIIQTGKESRVDLSGIIDVKEIAREVHQFLKERQEHSACQHPRIGAITKEILEQLLELKALAK